MGLFNIDLLSDYALLQVYGKAKTNQMFTQLFSGVGVSDEILDFITQLNREISTRGLDRKKANAAD